MNSSQRQTLLRSARKGDQERRRKAQVLARAILWHGEITPEIKRQLTTSTPDIKHMLELLVHPPAAFLAALPSSLRSATFAILVSFFAFPVAIMGFVIADFLGVLGWPN